MLTNFHFPAGYDLLCYQPSELLLFPSRLCFVRQLSFPFRLRSALIPAICTPLLQFEAVGSDYVYEYVRRPHQQEAKDYNSNEHRAVFTMI